MNDKQLENLSPDKFVFVQQDKNIKDTSFQTKPVGYFQDAWYRFSRNKGSVVAGVIILALILFAIIVPFFARHSVNDADSYYKYMPAKSEKLAKFGILDGKSKVKGINQQMYDYYNAIPQCVVSVDREYEVTDSGRTQKYYDLTIDSYRKVGYAYKLLTKGEYEAVLDYQKESGVQLLAPMINTNLINNPSYTDDANMWYENNPKGAAIYNNGEYTPIFLTDPESEDGYKYYIEKNGGAQYQVRVYYYDYYKYEHGYEPAFLFGTDGYGKDILANLASGARLSFLLAFSIAIINFCIGTLIGAIEGYYGGKVDIIIERIIEIIVCVPFIIIVTLMQLYLLKKIGSIPTLILAFMISGWTGIAGRVRTQFYRFKGQEYVLAARTLGAKDRRLIFRHILPNALGTIVTTAVLMVPSVIFSEASLSFLGIVDFQTSNQTSIGTMLQIGQSCLTTNPQVIFFPAVFISLLMICFNMFGNGLRDALNPSLRGSEE